MRVNYSTSGIMLNNSLRILFVYYIFFYIGTAAEQLYDFFDVQPQNLTVIIGHSAVFSCCLINESLRYDIQWIRGNSLVNSSKHIVNYPIQYRHSRMGLCHHSFFIDHVLLQDETTFQCRLIIFNMDNNTAPLIIESHIAYLKVLHPTERLSIVQGDQVEVNEELEFEIEYILQNGTPPTELFWMDDRNTNIITNNVDNRIKIQEDKLWTIRSVLKITPKKIDHC